MASACKCAFALWGFAVEYKREDFPRGYGGSNGHLERNWARQDCDFISRYIAGNRRLKKDVKFRFLFRKKTVLYHQSNLDQVIIELTIVKSKIIIDENYTYFIKTHVRFIYMFFLKLRLSYIRIKIAERNFYEFIGLFFLWMNKIWKIN